MVPGSRRYEVVQVEQEHFRVANGAVQVAVKWPVIMGGKTVELRTPPVPVRVSYDLKPFGWCLLALGAHPDDRARREAALSLGEHARRACRELALAAGRREGAEAQTARQELLAIRQAVDGLLAEQDR
jgi:hypothetical protein